MHKTCYTCGEVKLTTEFGVRSNNKDGRSGNCKSCLAVKQKDFYVKNPEKYLRHKQRVCALRLKVPLADCNAVRYRSGGVCECCGIKEATCIDHDHATGLVRGHLCAPCNRGIGMFYDNPQSLRNAASYLERSSKP